MDIKDYISDGKLRVKVKPNSKKTEITGYSGGLINVNLNARPTDNEANIELVKYFSRLLKNKVRIKTGLKSKEKVLIIG